MSPCSLSQTLIVQIARANAVFLDSAVSNKPLEVIPPQSRRIILPPTKQKKLGNNSMAFNIAAMRLFSFGFGLLI